MFNAIEAAIQALDYYATQFLRDFDAIPLAERTRTFPQAGSSAAEIVRQCAFVARRHAALLSNQEPTADYHPAPPADDPEEARRDFEAALEELRGALRALTPDMLQQERPMPWGATMLLEQVIFRSSYHLAYHNGQLCYIQLLLGDREFHSG